jgi:uncharacterized protein
MPYIIETFDKPGHAALRAQERNAHLAFLARHSARLLASGAKLDDAGGDLGGGLYVVDFETRDEAKYFIEDDPYARAGLFERVTITRWRKAYVAGECYL